MSNEIATTPSLEAVVRDNPQLNDPATLDGIASLVGKLAPLIQGERFHNLVDLASALSDVVDMADNAMVEKLARDYENLAAGAFNLSSSLRYASAQAGAHEDPPSLWQTIRALNRDDDARRGLAVVISLLTLLGRESRMSAQVMAED